MGETKVAARKQRSLAKGLIAGLIGGLAGTVAKTFAERVFPPQTHTPTAPDAAVRWGLGAAVGATYGAVAEFYPEATAKRGASFGLALEALEPEGALPAVGLTAEAGDETVRERSSEITSHVVYGVVTEFVRSLVRRCL